jgi:hypothetical protein
LAGLVRNDQDLAAEAQALDKAILEAVSEEPAMRDAAAEQRIRDRMAEIAKRAKALAERRAARARVAVTRGCGEFWQGASIDRAMLARSLRHRR